MNKRITSLLLCLVMIVSLLVTAVPVFAAGSVKFTMTSDKAKASPGDTITYTVTMGEVSRFDSLKYKLSIPEGLTFVAGSGKLADNLKETLNCVDTAWTESTKVFYITLCSDGIGYTSTTPTELMTFQCKVDDGATGSLKIEFIIEPNNCYDSDYDNIAFTTETPSITITAAPKPATDIKLNKSETTIYTGNTETLVATVEPSDTTDTVTWTSNKESVATVDSNGKVTAVAPGTATITATAGSKSASCTVTVENAPCVHVHKTTLPEKASTCKDKGWDAYKKCDDCGQLFDMSDHKIDAIPFRPLSTTHTGGTATCTAKAVCSVCHQPYDDYAAHSYTAETKKAEALKTAGNCRDKAVYYYSCSVCGNVEHNDAHTFLGDKNASVHVGGTSTVNASEPNHKNQVDGYTGDTKCLGCGQITATGTSIPAGAHTPSSTWNSDGTYHWKECTTMGCGVVIDGSKAKHSSTGTNVATCQHKAICDVCGVEYGALAAHNPASVWTSDVSGHWHACQTANCTAKCDFATHTPDHTGHATEEYAIKCTECGYVIEAQLSHTHVFDKEGATDAYKASDATCTAKATYYKSCACGEKGTATFEYGELADHNWMPATCTAPKTCNTCRATEGDPLGHDYTKKVENNTYLKTAASNCKEHNVYWYACSRCDANAKDDAAATDKYYTSTTAGNHSFTEKIEDAAHYVAGTGTNCQSVKKYYYDCAYCDQIGTTTWNSTTYGPHDYDTVWSNDKSGHWHECSLCHDKKDEAAHTPGAAATETTPQKCTECDYIITPALGHTHSLTPVAAEDATCTNDGNTAYYVCSGCSKWYEDAAGITVNIAERTLIRTTARLKR